MRGLVQGVGYRPFVHQVASRHGLVGFVGNDGDGVFVEVEGSASALGEFVAELRATAPPLARVETVEVHDVPSVGGLGFAIVASEGAGPVSTYVAPDAAVCDDCLAELFDPADRRHRYPFITCTNCGPRFTITRSLPYDRPATTMAGFDLCPACAAQYADPADRRFHAQPLACADCGPQVRLDDGTSIVAGTDAAVAGTQRLLAAGAIVAVKGIGGYHLACDATLPAALDRLRQRKHRLDKPFAVLARDLEACRRLAEVDALEAAELTSPARPIVLLRARVDGPLAAGVAPGNPLVGVLLPYTPLHHLLLAPVPGHPGPVPELLVLTSGNLTDEPICFDDDDARVRLGAIADAFLLHDRPIHVPCDDSIVRVVDGEVLPIRRSRGYAPMPIRLPTPSPPMLAVGGELKNTFCLARGRDAWLGQHIGDMGSVETLIAFERSVAQYRALYGVEPVAVAADLHPGYHTTAWAERAGLGPVVGVQHHHAHLAALLAEHGEPLDTEVLGVVFDGTGYGTDATIWGGELLLGGYAAVERVGHLRPVPLPGGDAAIRRPYRAALAHLWDAGIEWEAHLAPVAAASPGELGVLARQLERGFRCVATTSMGRLFDAVASLLGVRQVVSYEAQASLELEALAAGEGVAAGAHDRYCFGVDGGVSDDGGDSELDARPVLHAIVADLEIGTPVPVIAAGFHAAVAGVIVTSAERIGAERGCRTVGLTGGVFQNAVLVTMARRRLAEAGFRVLTHRLVPPNDGGLALGQIAVAAARAETRDHRSPRED